MRYLLCIATLLLSFVSLQAQNLSAQQANDRVGELINNSDLVTLSRELPSLRDHHIYKPLLALADALVAYNNGQAAKSNEAIDRVSEYAPELGGEVVFNMLQLSIYNHLLLESYAQGEQIANLILQTMPEGEASAESRAPWESTIRWMGALKERKAVEIIRPAGDVTLPVEVRDIGRGKHLIMTVTVGEKSQEAIFDTGCSFANFVSSEVAERLGVEIVAEDIIVRGVGKGYARLGVLPEMKLGDVVIKNTTFLVVDEIVPENAKEDGMCELVIGTHIIRKLGEVRVRCGEGKIILPAKPSEAPKEQNLYYNAGQYFLRCTHAEQDIMLHFDTGNTKTQLSSKFFDRFKSMVEAEGGEVERSRSGGFGGVTWCDVRTLPKVKLEVEGRELALKDVEVNMPTQYEDGSPFKESYDGSMGVDMLSGAEQVTLDLGRMFFRVDK